MTDPRFIELHRREEDGRVLVCYGADGWYMIANEDDVARQSVVLTTKEVRWLYWEALGGRESAELADALRAEIVRLANEAKLGPMTQVCRNADCKAANRTLLGSGYNRCPSCGGPLTSLTP